MKLRCLLGHKWRKVPWFKPRPGTDPHWWRPDWMCMRCFKERREAVLRIGTIEGPGIGYYLPPYYEGQRPPEGYDSWGQYWKKAKDNLLKGMRQ